MMEIDYLEKLMRTLSQKFPIMGKIETLKNSVLWLIQIVYKSVEGLKKNPDFGMKN